MASNLKVCLVQTKIEWEKRSNNLNNYTEKLKEVSEDTHVVIFPEMFDTGFTMQPERLALTMTGQTIQWMREQAIQHKKIIGASTMIKEDDNYYNRFIWMLPNGYCHYYDKAHLFGMAGEDNHFTKGSKRVIVQVNGWRILLQTCYDLRFPVWARQQKELYDAIIYVANWPATRMLAWNTLLKARAIENQCFVLGVNCVGVDGNQLDYSGNSAIYDPLGETIWRLVDEEGIGCINMDKSLLENIRSKFQFLNDRDSFMIM